MNVTALGDVIIQALQDLLEILFYPISQVIRNYSDDVIDAIVSTPYPNAVFARPTNGAWPRIYDYYWETLIPLSLFLWALSVGLVILLESTSHLFSGYHRSKLKKRAVSGLFGVLSWWWLAALSLQFTDGLTAFLVPSLADISLFETLSFTAMGVLGLVISLTVDLVLFVLIALIYFARQVALYLFVLLMPLLIVLWIPGVGPFALVSRFMKQLAGFYAPFLFMTVPVALLFRLGELLGSSFGLSMSGIGAWLIALIIPIVAVVSPFVLFWQAGALLLVGDRVARHTSRRRAYRRRRDAQKTVGDARRAGDNFNRGLHGTQALGRDGNYLIDPTRSRAYVAGSRLASAGSTLRERFRSRPARSNPGGGASSGAHEGGSSNPPRGFHALRHRGEPPRPARDHPEADRPYYID